MSALPPKADMCSALAHVRFGPKADSCTAANSLFDQFVRSPDERVGDVDAERLCGLEVYDQFDFGRLLDRQVGGLFALENAAGVDAGYAVCVCGVRSIAKQAAGRGELAILKYCGHGVADGQCGKLFGMAGEKWATADYERVCPQLNQLCKDTTEIIFTAGIDDMKFQPKIAGCR